MEHTVRLQGSRGEHELQERYGTQARADRFYDQQVLDHLNEQMRAFVSRQELLFVATSDGSGACDNSLRAGPPGFIQVLDDKNVAYPEYRGNGVMASLGNLSENPNIGLLLIDFIQDVIGLHVNGTARIVEDAAMRAAFPSISPDPAPGRRPERWVWTTVDEAYIHCSKHIPRLARVPSERHWGTDDVRRKGGDFFEARAALRR